MYPVNGPTSAPGARGGPAGQFVSASQQRYEMNVGTLVSLAPLLGSFSYTVGGWINLTAKAANSTIIATWSGSNGSMSLDYDQPTDRFRYIEAAGTTVSATAAGSPAVDRWYFVLAWRDVSAATLNIQVNGGGVTSAASATPPAEVARPIAIGSLPSGGGNFCNGRLEGIGYWRRVLGPVERASLYAQPYQMFAAPAWRRYFVPPPPPPGAESRYLLSRPQGPVSGGLVHA